ncbi:hypothetical protein LDC_1733, partial [sediment metagenome]
LQVDGSEYKDYEDFFGYHEKLYRYNNDWYPFAVVPNTYDLKTASDDSSDAFKYVEKVSGGLELALYMVPFGEFSDMVAEKNRKNEDWTNKDLMYGGYLILRDTLATASLGLIPTMSRIASGTQVASKPLTAITIGIDASDFTVGSGEIGYGLVQGIKESYINGELTPSTVCHTMIGSVMVLAAPGNVKQYKTLFNKARMSRGVPEIHDIPVEKIARESSEEVMQETGRIHVENLVRKYPIGELVDTSVGQAYRLPSGFYYPKLITEEKKLFIEKFYEIVEVLESRNVDYANNILRRNLGIPEHVPGTFIDETVESVWKNTQTVLQSKPVEFRATKPITIEESEIDKIMGVVDPLERESLAERLYVNSFLLNYEPEDMLPQYSINTRVIYGNPDVLIRMNDGRTISIFDYPAVPGENKVIDTIKDENTLALLEEVQHANQKQFLKYVEDIDPEDPILAEVGIFNAPHFYDFVEKTIYKLDKLRNTPEWLRILRDYGEMDISLMQLYYRRKIRDNAFYVHSSRSNFMLFINGEKQGDDLTGLLGKYSLDEYYVRKSFRVLDFDNRMQREIRDFYQFLKQFDRRFVQYNFFPEWQSSGFSHCLPGAYFSELEYPNRIHFTYVVNGQMVASSRYYHPDIDNIIPSNNFVMLDNILVNPFEYNKPELYYYITQSIRSAALEAKANGKSKIVLELSDLAGERVKEVFGGLSLNREIYNRLNSDANYLNVFHNKYQYITAEETRDVIRNSGYSPERTNEILATIKDDGIYLYPICYRDKSYDVIIERRYIEVDVEESLRILRELDLYEYLDNDRNYERILDLYPSDEFSRIIAGDFLPEEQVRFDQIEELLTTDPNNARVLTHKEKVMILMAHNYEPFDRLGEEGYDFARIRGKDELLMEAFPGDENYNIRRLLIENNVAGSIYKLDSKIKDYNSLVKIAESLNKRNEKDINNLIKRLADGNENPGYVNHALTGGISHIWECGSQDGARVYYIKSGDTITILAKSNKNNQDETIELLRKYYSK